MRSHLVRATSGLGVVLFHLGLAGSLIRRSRQGVRVLLYHAIGPDSSRFFTGLGPPLPTESFEEHLDWLVDHYEPITLSDLSSGHLPDRAVLVTFDDGYRSLWTHAREPLRSRGIRPVVHLIGSVVDNEALAWTNELAWALHENPSATQVEIDAVVKRRRPTRGRFSIPVWSSLSEAEILEILGRVRGQLQYDPAELARAAQLYLDWDQVEALREEGWSFGSHTAHHYSLLRMPSERQMLEIQEGVEQTRGRLGRVEAFAYPFGDFDAKTRELVLETDHKYAMEVGGVNSIPPDVTRIGRIPGDEVYTRAELFARMEVVNPIKAWFAARRDSR